MADIFTHYDLHSKNILLYELPEGKYIQMNYIDKNGKLVTSFKTIYIPKIIDYGRSFFYANKKLNSKILYDEILCKVKPCNKRELNEKCGNESGYSFFEFDKDLKPLEEEHYISAPIRNKSHDLRLAFIFKEYIKMFNVKVPVMKKLLDDILYKEPYGTPEVLENYTRLIKNVEHMKLELERRILHQEYFKNNLENYFTQRSENYTCIGTLNIYEKITHKMEFIPE